MAWVLYLTNGYQVLYRVGRRQAAEIWSLSGDAWPEFPPECWNGVSRVRLLSDLIEEEFRLERLPHVGGRDHRALVERKRRQLFRDEPLVMVERLGREKVGRRDDRVLFTAVRGSSALENCLAALRRWRVGVSGIWSFPHLSESWCLPPLAEGLRLWLYPCGERTAVRQHYLQRQRLVFSRLSLLSCREIAVEALQELDRTWRYLIRSLGLPADAGVNVQIVAPSSLRSEVMAVVSEHPVFRGYFPEAGKRFAGGRRNDACRPEVVATELGSRWLVRSHYAAVSRDPERLRRHRQFQMYLGSLGLLLASVGYGGYAWWKGRLLNVEAEALLHRYEVLNRKLERLPEPERVLGFDPWQMAAALELKGDLDRRRVNPRAVLLPISRVLDRFPEVTMDSLGWKRENDALVMRLFLRMPLEGDLQAGAQRIDRFRAEMERQREIESARLLESSLPLLTEGTVAGLAGLLAKLEKQATFTIEVRLRGG